MLRRSLIWAAALLLAVTCRTAGATGLMIPGDVELPPLAIKSHRVNVKVEAGLATTRVDQVFVNNTRRRLEASYIFPLPRGAALTDFALYINGKRRSGEVLEAGKARRVYEDIVRRLRDPGLLEYLDCGLLRMRVFPIEPRSETRVELSYGQSLRFDGGVYEYTFPLKTGHRAPDVLEDFTVTVDISSPVPIKSVYSPTHEIGVTRKDEHHAIAGFEQQGGRLDTDFTLFYSVSREEFGLNLLTHRTRGEDGYFAVMISPSVGAIGRKIIAKDVCFVIDTSGSMKQQDRIGSARRAVEFCLKALNPGDRFALVTFNTAVETYGDGLIVASRQAVRKAVEYVRGLEARGGTDLCGAVLKALDLAPDSDRPYLVVLVTDGKPTVGVTSPEKIIQKVQEANRRNIRVFPFGIAEQLNVVLLDRIAEVTRGYSDYVAPGREIEDRISSFFRKVGNPVLTDLELDFGRVRVHDLYPRQLPDLFRGSQLVAFGRYSGSGEVAIKLTGRLADRRHTFAYDASFPRKNAANGFLPQLWARRKIGYLLDQIRLHGESKELVDEVVRLSKEHGIATPYTSYLVLEDAKAYGEHGIIRRGTLGRLRDAGVLNQTALEAPRGRAEAGSIAGLPLAAPAGAAAGGRNAIDASKALRALKEAKVTEELASAGNLRRVGSKTFVRVGGAYVDTAFSEKMETLQLKFGSDAYFAALDALPELKDYLALGECVVVVVGDKALIIAEEGKEKMSADEIRRFFGR